MQQREFKTLIQNDLELNRILAHQGWPVDFPKVGTRVPPATAADQDEADQATEKMTSSVPASVWCVGLIRQVAAIPLCVLFSSLAMAVPTDSPDSAQPTLQQFTELLQKNPADDALRERIIKLARETRPAPAMSKEALYHAERGTLALKKAATEQGYLDAAHEYEQSSRLAPWAGEIYRQLGIAYEKAGDGAVARVLSDSQALKTCRTDDRQREWERFKLHSRSEQYFKWYLLATPDAPDADETWQRFQLRARDFFRWKMAWDQQCCLGCRGTQGSPR